MPPALSFVIPLYHSAETIADLVHAIQRLSIEGGHEIILVNDGSRDRTRDVCLDLVREAPGVSPGVPITLVEHSRNFGEHNAVLTGWRYELVGADLVRLLQGDLGLKIDPKQHHVTVIDF